MNTPEILAYNIFDACKALGVGRTNLYRLIAEGQIEARALGGRTVVPAESLRAFVSRLPPAPIREKAVNASAHALSGVARSPRRAVRKLGAGEFPRTIVRSNWPVARSS